MTLNEDSQGPFKVHFVILAVSVAIVNTGFGIIFPLFPVLLMDIGGGDASDLGLMAAFFAASFLIGAPIFGNLADRTGKKRVILIGLVGFTLSNFIYIYAWNLEMLYLARGVEGFFAAAILPPAVALTTQIIPEGKTGRYLGLLGASQTTGIIVGPVLGGFLYEGFRFNGLVFSNGEFITQVIVIKGSVTLPFWVSALMGFLAFIWSYSNLPASKTRQKKQLLEDETVSNPPSISGRIRGTLSRQVEVLPKPLHMFFLFALAEMLAIAAWFVISPGFIFYFYEDLLLTPRDFGFFVASFGIASVLGQSLLGNVSDKVGRKPVLIIGQLFSFLFYYSLLEARTLQDLMIAVVFVGIGSGLRDPAMKAWLADVTDEDSRATVFGIESGIMSSSQILGPIIGGYLYIQQGMRFMFFIAIAINIINVFVLASIRFSQSGGLPRRLSSELVPAPVN